MSVRNKPGKGRKFGVGPTKNPMHRTPGKRRGLWVYDGQRIPEGTLLVNQVKPNVFPGWNVRFGHMNQLRATVEGRVIITTEMMNPNWSHYKMQKFFGEHLKKEDLFKHFIHVVPDKQHQYFKLVEEI